MKIGIVGLPNVGKSTLFTALTKRVVPAENYPFCTIEPNVGIVPVPDLRLRSLATVSRSNQTIPTIIEFMDIAGLVAGAHKGEGLGNKFLANIREVDAIIHLIRAFENPDITHVSGKIDPLDDKKTILIELILADLEFLQKIMHATEKKAKAEKEAKYKLEVLRKIQAALESEHLVSEVSLKVEEKELIKDLQFLTAKPFLTETVLQKQTSNLLSNIGPSITNESA